MRQGKFLRLHEVFSIHKTVEPDVLIIKCKITDYEGETYDAVHVLRPNDPYGLTPTIRQWVADHPDFPVQEYVPPTLEERRADPNLRPVPRYDFRMAMRAAGVTADKIVAYLASIADPNTKDEHTIYWEDRSFMRRLDPFVVGLGQFAGLSDATLDKIFGLEVPQ